MSVIRSFKRKDPYTALSNEVLRNPRLSNSAIGLWAKCQSRPLDWEFHIVELAKNGRDKKTAIYRQINELIEEGLCVRMQRMDKSENGKMLFRGVEYVFFPDRATDEQKAECLEDLKKCFPYSCFRNSETGYTLNRQLQKNDRKNDKEKILEKNDSDSVHKSEPKPETQKQQEPQRPEKPSAIAYRSSCKSKPIAPLPAAHRSPAAKEFDPVKFDPETYKMPNGKLLSARCVNHFKKYVCEDKAKLIANIELFEKKYHDGMKNPEAYLQSCVTNNYAKREINKMNNILFTKFIIEEYNIKTFRICNTVVKFDDGNVLNQESIRLDSCPETFEILLKRCLKKNNVKTA